MTQAIDEAVKPGMGPPGGGGGAAKEPAQQAHDATPTAQEPKARHQMPMALPESCQMMTLVDRRAGVMLQNSASIR